MSRIAPSPSSTFADSFETVGRFFDDVAHEFRNPITAIKGFASILEEGLAGELSSSQRDYLRIIGVRADDLNRLVDNMLDLSRVEAAAMRATRRECTVASVITRVQATVAKRAAAANITLAIDADSRCPSLYGDIEQIARALSNLTFNAFRSSGENGRVEIMARYHKNRAAAVFSVSDNGPTLSADRRRVMLDGFRDGVGLWRVDRTFNLSLSLVRELVKLNLGDLDVTATPEDGNSFSFTVPIFDAASILSHYACRLEDSTPARAFLLDMTVTLAATTRIDIAEPLLQQQTGMTELLLRADERSWRLLASARSSVEAELRARALRETLGDLERDVGAIEVSAARLWELPVERDELIAALGNGASRPPARQKRLKRR